MDVVLEGACLLVVLIGRLGRRRAGLVGNDGQVDHKQPAYMGLPYKNLVIVTDKLKQVEIASTCFSHSQTRGALGVRGGQVHYPWYYSMRSAI